jgi:glycosyltransferase involved in cell wall biosynthesis
MRIAALTRYTDQGASSRVRFHDWASHLAPHGIFIDYFPLFTNAYLSSFYNDGKKPLISVVKSYLRRIRYLFSIGEYDAIWLEKEMLPYVPLLEPLIIKLLNRPLIVDIDDAIFHQYDQSSSLFVRNILGKKVDSIFEASTCVIAGNSYLAERARQAGAKRVEVIPTLVSTTKYIPRLESTIQTDDILIGWIGSPSTEKYLDIVRPTLNELSNNHKCKTSLIGASATAAAQLHAELHKWSPDTEASMISNMDIGIMPLADSLWERGKCGYKLIQYMACGLPTVASDVGVNSQIIIHGKTGFVARTEEEWLKYLSILLNDRNLRHSMGRLGRRIFEEKYSYEGLTMKMQNIFITLNGTTA